MKKIFTLLMAFILSTSIMSGCSLKAKSYDVEIKGAFLLDEEKMYADHFISRELDGNKYFLVVYDVVSTSDKNIELNDNEYAAKLKFNNTNEYTQLKIDGNTIAGNFIKRSGYTTFDECETLQGGSSNALHMISVFSINGNDIKDDTKSTIEFNLGGNSTIKKDIDNDFKVITLLDEIFDYKDNYTNHQIANSVPVRANFIEPCLKGFENREAIKAMQGYYDINETIDNLRSAFDTNHGVSVGGIYNSEFSTPYALLKSDSLPAFDLGAVQEIFPDIAGNVEYLMKLTNAFADLLESNNYSIKDASDFIFEIRKQIAEIDYFYGKQ